MPFPSLRERGHREGASEQTLIGLGGDLQRRDVEYGDAARVMSNDLQTIAGGQFTLSSDRKVEARTTAVEEALDHVIASEPDAELETGQARLRHRELDRTDADAIADGEIGLEKAGGGEVLTKRPPRERIQRQFPSPVLVVLGRIAVNRLLEPAVDRQIGLSIALEVERRDPDRPFHRLLPDRRPDFSPRPRHIW